MEEKKEKKKLNKKPLLICLAIALVFAIIGFMDIKANAAESNSIDFYYLVYNNDNVAQKYKKRVTGQDDMEVFYCQSHIENTNTENTYAQAYVVSKSPMTYYDYTIGTSESNMGQEYFNGSYPSVEYTINGQTFYIRETGHILTNTGNGSWNGYVELEFDTTFPKTKISRWYDLDEFAQAYANDYLETIIDYDNLPIDDEMAIPSDFLVNKVIDKTDYNAKVYDYITWKNNADYMIQVDIAPYLYVYEKKKMGFEYGTLLKSYDWEDVFITDIVSARSDKYIFEVFESDDFYPEKDYIPEFMEYYLEKRKEFDYGTFGEHKLYYSVGYRFRYVDIENSKAGPWVVVEPDRKNLGSYCSYIWYSDGYFTSNFNSSGSNSSFNDGNLDNALNDVDRENQFKEEYEIVDGDVDTQEATNWLYTVVNFIKGTPQVVGSVLGFLPQPILYGMYVCIFLGVIASGVAIVKALI